MQRAVGLRASQRSAVPMRPVRGVAPLVRCSAVKEDKHESFVQKLAMPVAAAVTASAIICAVQLAAPGEALAARSGGRAGASSFSARRAAPSRAAASRPTVNNYSTTTIVAAPPIYSPFGFGGGFGFGGFRIMPVIPIPFFGGLLQLMFLMLIVSVVFNVVKGALGSGSSSSNKKNQDW